MQTRRLSFALRTCQRAVLIATLAAASVHAHAAEATVGWVFDYQPPHAEYLLTRAGLPEPIKVKLGTPLLADDLIDVTGSGKVVLQLVDGSEREVVGPGSWRVPTVQLRSSSLLVLRSLAGKLDTVSQLAGNAATRSAEGCFSTKKPEPISVPLLSRKARVGAGTQSLLFMWLGGCGPFKVSIVSEGKKVIVESPSISENRFEFLDVSLAPGNYRLIVGDARGAKQAFPFTTSQARPAVPADIAENTSTAYVLARALWLADVDGGAWRLESLKALRPLLIAGQPTGLSLADYFLLYDKKQEPP